MRRRKIHYLVDSPVALGSRLAGTLAVADSHPGNLVAADNHLDSRPVAARFRTDSPVMAVQVD